MQLDAIDGGDDIVWLEAGALGGCAGADLADGDGRGLDARVEAEGIEREALRLALVVDLDGGVGALAVVEEGEGKRLVEVQQGVDADVFPVGIPVWAAGVLAGM